MYGVGTFIEYDVESATLEPSIIGFDTPNDYGRWIVKHNAGEPGWLYSTNYSTTPYHLWHSFFFKYK